ncbi:hypothetical protein PR048_012780 [Dryococelus australis]|uniref:Uncharacterized protein n=1 Tax=Dryococelus australis TaxID=614101 RepID=A0ABQ9HRS7_9NEOP|nr:hypothetical protein PR048_012780 [Dryococelus australis]
MNNNKAAQKYKLFQMHLSSVCKLRCSDSCDYLTLEITWYFKKLIMSVCLIFLTVQSTLMYLTNWCANIFPKSAQNDTFSIINCLQKLKETETIIKIRETHLISFGLYLKVILPVKINKNNKKLIPKEAFVCLKLSYGNHFDMHHLRSELVAKLNFTEFRSKPVIEIMELLKQSDLNPPFQQQDHLLNNLLSTLNRIKTYIINSQKQDMVFKCPYHWADTHTSTHIVRWLARDSTHDRLTAWLQLPSAHPVTLIAGQANSFSRQDSTHYRLMLTQGACYTVGPVSSRLEVNTSSYVEDPSISLWKTTTCTSITPCLICPTASASANHGSPASHL